MNELVKTKCERALKRDGYVIVESNRLDEITNVHIENSVKETKCFVYYDGSRVKKIECNNNGFVIRLGNGDLVRYHKIGEELAESLNYDDMYLGNTQHFMGEDMKVKDILELMSSILSAETFEYNGETYKDIMYFKEAIVSWNKYLIDCVREYGENGSLYLDTFEGWEEVYPCKEFMKAVEECGYYEMLSDISRLLWHDNVDYVEHDSFDNILRIVEHVEEVEEVEETTDTTVEAELVEEEVEETESWCIDFQIMSKSTSSTKLNTKYAIQSTKVGKRLADNIVKNGVVTVHGIVSNENTGKVCDYFSDIKCYVVDEEEEIYHIECDGLNCECTMREIQEALQECVNVVVEKITNKYNELKANKIIDFKIGGMIDGRTVVAVDKEYVTFKDGLRLYKLFNCDDNYYYTVLHTDYFLKTYKAKDLIYDTDLVRITIDCLSIENLEYSQTSIIAQLKMLVDTCYSEELIENCKQLIAYVDGISECNSETSMYVVQELKGLIAV